MQTAPSLTAFTAFDWALVLMVVASTALAYRKGFIRVLFSMVGVVAGIILASWNYLALAVTLHRWIDNFKTAQVTAFLLILVLVVMAVAWLGKLLRSAVKAIGLGFVDRLLGALIGLVRGALLGLAAMMLVAAFFPRATWVKNSQLAPYFLGGIHAVSFVVPVDFEHQMAVGARYLLHETPELFRPHTLTQHMH